MADRFAPEFPNKVKHSGHFGNGHNDDFTYAVAAATPASSADKLYLGVVPPGVRVNLAELLWTGTAPGAGVTSSLGYEPVDAAKGPAANLTYWVSALATAAAGRNALNAAPITFDQPVKIVLTIGGANVANGAVATAVLRGQIRGVS